LRMGVCFSRKLYRPTPARLASAPTSLQRGQAEAAQTWTSRAGLAAEAGESKEWAVQLVAEGHHSRCQPQLPGRLAGCRCCASPRPAPHKRNRQGGWTKRARTAPLSAAQQACSLQPNGWRSIGGKRRLTVSGQAPLE
jgi:hypothetical protein